MVLKQDRSCTNTARGQRGPRTVPVPTLRLWHLADKPLASQKEKRVPWGQAPPRRLRSSGRPEPDRQREWEDTLGDHIAKVQSHKGKTGEGPGTPGGHPLPSEGGPGQAEPSLAEEMVQGPLFGPWSRRK